MMQIEHETQLVGSTPINVEVLDALQDGRSLDRYVLAQRLTANTVEKLSTSSASNLCAVYFSSNNQVALFDLTGNTKRERFSLKSCNKQFSRQSFVAKGIKFSPDGKRLATGQTDSIIYIYRLAASPLESDYSDATDAKVSKPTITGKYVCSSPVTCLIWPECGIIFGTQDGKIKLIQLSNNKITETQTSPSQLTSTQSAARVTQLFSSPKNIMPISLSHKSPVLAIGFLDNTVILLKTPDDQVASGRSDFNGETNSHSDVRRNSALQSSPVSIEHSCPPNHLLILQSDTICCAGSDGRVSFHSLFLESPSSVKLPVTKWVQNIDLREDIVAMDYSHINEIIVVATRSRLQFISFDQDTSSWHLQNSFIGFAHTASLTCAAWSRDGSQLIVGGLNGSVDIFRCEWSQNSISGQLDIYHISKNRVRIRDKARNLCATYKTRHDIKRVNIMDNGLSVIIWTAGSVLLARHGLPPSEMVWEGEQQAKFHFEPSGLVLVYRDSRGDLLIVRLGQDSIVFKTKVESLTQSTFSVRRYPPLAATVREQPDDAAIRDKHSSPDCHRSAMAATSSGRLLRRSSSEESDQQVAHMIAKEKLVFVFELNKLNVIDLQTSSKRFIYHNSSIVRTSLSYSGSYLIYCDNRGGLYIDQAEKEIRNEILQVNSPQLVGNSCKFADWMPESDTLVAQLGHSIYVWYDIKLTNLNDKTQVDSRDFNLNSRAPIIDLSLMSRAELASARASYPVVTNCSDGGLNLSNGSIVPLNQDRLSFSRSILARGLPGGYEVLKSGGVTSSKNLWAKLAWLAVEDGNYDIAIKSFEELGHIGIVRYLRNNLDTKRSEQEREIVLLKLLGNWESFEQAAEKSEIVSTYRRINKWSRLLDYLSRTQQFRQRDLEEREYRLWLTSKGRYAEAANLQAKQGDIVGAIELLVDNEKLDEASDLLINEANGSSQQSGLDSKLSSIARGLKNKLLVKSRYSKAAVICDKLLSDSNEALELYLKGEDYQSALGLAKDFAPDREAEICELLGESIMQSYRSYLISRRKSLPAIDHFLTANDPRKALEASLELKSHEKAAEILRDLSKSNVSLKEYETQLQRVAEALARNHQLDEAIDLFMMGHQYEQVVEHYWDSGDYEKAFDVSVGYVHPSDRQLAVQEFIERAIGLTKEGKSAEAERVYLILDEPDLAIEMHRQVRNYDQMLELTRQTHPDLLESCLFQLAKELELEGDYESAERYLLRASASEWTSVVRMYRLANKWPDAYRVARANCASSQDPLLVQLAYWWAKSIYSAASSSGESPKGEIKSLLNELKVLSPVIEFCCENKNFQFALDVCDGSQDLGDLRREILRRYAAHLEQQHKFAQAEALLVQNGLVELAVRMYIDNGQHSDAIRIIEGQLGNEKDSDSPNQRRLVELLNETLVEFADQMAHEAWPIGTNRLMAKTKARPEAIEKLTAAQQMYLRAQRPELAVELYKKRGLWQEAVQVAQRYAPNLLEGVERALDEQVSADLGPIVATAAASRSSSRSSGLVTSNSGFATTTDGFSIDRSSGGRDSSLRSQVESSMRLGNSKDARQALGEYMDSITNGDTNEISDYNSSGKQVSRTEELLMKLEQLVRHSSLRNSPTSNGGSHLMDEVLSLAQQVSYGCCRIVACRLSSEERLSTWTRLRDILASFMESHGQSDASDKLYEYLIVAHFSALREALLVVLENRLDIFNKSTKASANSVITPSRAEKFLDQVESIGEKDVVSLISKLSLSLLRYTQEIIEPKCAFYGAGLWLLVQGRSSPVRIVWTRLLELVDGQIVSRIQKELKLLDIWHHNMTEENAKGTCGPSGEQLAEVRAWLLSHLIDGNECDDLDSRGVYESSLRESNRDREQTFPVCLASGYPVLGSEQLILGERLGRIYFARNREWQQLLQVKRRADQMKTYSSKPKWSEKKRSHPDQSSSLADSIEFIQRLSGFKD